MGERAAPAPATDSTYCHRCGTRNPSGARRCRGCGADPADLSSRAAPAGRLPTAADQHWALPDAVSTLLPHVAPHRRRAFWLAFAIGTAVMLAWGAVAWLNPDTAFVSRLLVFGAFYIPVLFVFFMASEALVDDAPVLVLVEVFAGAALVGNLAAALLNTYLPLGNLGVGPVEEAVKFGAVVWLLRRRTHPRLMEGILFGAAAGMGFAASENLNYFLTGYVGSGLQAVVGGGGLGLPLDPNQTRAVFERAGFAQLVNVFVARSVFAPWMHGAWTAILAGVAWREARGGRLHIDVLLLATYAGLAALHSLWDAIPSGWPEWTLFPAIVAFDVLTLRWLLRWAHLQELVEAAPLSFDGQPIPSGAFHCPACGAAVDLRARFCPHCGRSVADAVRVTATGRRLGRSLRPVAGAPTI